MKDTIPGTYVLTAGCNRIDLPMDDPELGAALRNPKAIIPALLDQINRGRLYDKAFSLRRGLVFLDIGAYVGLVSLHASDVCRRVVAVEPHPATFKVLERLVAPYKHIGAVNVALSDKDGTATFHDNDVNPTASSIENTYGTEVQVPTTTLSTLLRKLDLGHVDFCKVDIEGSEEKALTLDQLTLAKDTIKSYYVEVHNCPLSTWEQKLKALVGLFIQVGYRNILIRGDSIYASQYEL